eukprot:CAMPEP_0194563358 /NCGR_PEP_ID=MMETSP0292-20121207/3454_1 /TAXON_ID=39354 /ORGANISM="Heterosigma akashiwo, Strain CCMP2393" /LENGTH=62 /DNA_ID=CAMNT_0039412289 /DNA_START=78 /DNA_END=266 /DNA_ORIENTATION=-
MIRVASLPDHFEATLTITDATTENRKASGEVLRNNKAKQKQIGNSRKASAWKKTRNEGSRGR